MTDHLNWARSLMAGSAIVALVAAGCSGTSRSCDTEGQISVDCAQQLLQGFKPLEVTGYSVKAIYSTKQPGGRIILALQYGPSDGGNTPVILSAQEGTTTLTLQHTDVEAVSGLPVAFCENTGSYSASAVVDGVSYQVEVLVSPDPNNEDVREIRSRFVDSLAAMATQ